MLRLANSGETLTCVRLILSTPKHVADEGHVVGFFQNARARQLDLSKLLLAEQGGMIVWCVLPLVFPGRTAMYLSSPVSPVQVAAARLAIQHLAEQHTTQGIRLAQVMLDPADTAAHGFFESCGFRRLAELVYLEARSRELPVQLPPGFELANYSAATHGEFVAAINASYEKTLDCPALEGVRSTEDIIAGHKAAGAFHERYWFLIRQHGRPAGVLLLSPMPPTDAMELVYIGLATSARGKGLADPLMKFAFTTARQAGCHRLTTAVDSQNAPAMRMYMRIGMQRIGSRVAMMRILAGDVPKHPPVIPNGIVQGG